ncbi:MAG: pyrroline-5-carboxylate reductase [Nitrospirota bacterium]
MDQQKTKKIAFLGAGNMSEAIIKGILTAALFPAKDIIAADISNERLLILAERYAIQSARSNQEAAQMGNIIIIGVKPSIVEPLLDQVGPFLKGKLVISVAAGVPILRLMEKLNSSASVIRVMPNAAALVLAGAAVLSLGDNVTPAQLEDARSIFGAIGKTWVLEESLLDAVTGLSGSGPAFVMVMIEAMAQGGVQCGLPNETALALATQTVFGAGKWLLESQEHPARLKDFVASPGGTTIAGLSQLETHGVRSAFIAAVEAATKRSKELGLKKQ